MCGPTCSFDHTVWDGCARDDGTDSCDGFEQHNWRCFALSGQGHPSLRPAPLIQRASHTKVVHPHKEWQEIPAYVSWHSTTWIPAFILISSSCHQGGSGPRARGREEEASCNEVQALCLRWLLHQEMTPQWPQLWEWSCGCKRAWGNGHCQGQTISPRSFGRKVQMQLGKAAEDAMDKGKENGQWWIKKKLNTASAHGVVDLTGVTITEGWAVPAVNGHQFRF